MTYSCEFGRGRGSQDGTTSDHKVLLQGNYDPRKLIETLKVVLAVRHTAQQMLQEFGPQQLTATLGEGLSGNECSVLAQAFVDSINEESAAMIDQHPLY
jgi:hypothetical protein